MNALQVHYTSCRRGQSSGSGFQIRSCTPGLSQAELLEIARFGNYRLPSLLQHSDNRAKDVYPVALRYRQLQSGRVALIHSCYSGRDYSGREGNFMAHTVVPEQGQLLERPTNYFVWAGWKSRLTEEEDTSESPLPLPAIELPNLRECSGTARDFVTATPNGEAILVDLLTALLLVRATSRRIVIRDLPDHGWRWITCLLELVPLASALDVTISTYQFDPIDAAEVNATVEGSGFSFNATQRDYEFFLFQPATGLKPTFPDRDRALLAEVRRYAETVVPWYLREPQRLQEFSSFMDSFKACRVDRSLGIGLALFEQSASPQTPTITQFRQIVDFIGEYTPPAGWPRSITLLLQVLKSRSDSAQFDDIYEVVRMCLRAKSASDSASIAVQAFTGWNALLDLALDEPAKYSASVDQCWTEVTSHFDPSLGYRLLLADDRMDRLRNQYRRADTASFVLVSRYLIKAIRASHQEPLVEHPDVRELALIAANGSQPQLCLAAVFSSLKGISETGALLAYLDATADANEPIRFTLAQCLSKLTSANGETGWALRRLLYDQGHCDLLTAEFATVIEAGEKRKTYVSYLRDASTKIPIYYQSTHPELTRIYWQSLDEAGRASQAWDWLNAKSLPPLGPDILREVAIYANQTLSIDPRDSSQLASASRVADVAAAQTVDLRPDRPAIRKLLNGIDRGRDSTELLAEAAQLFADLREDEYAFAIDLILRQRLLLTKSVEDHVGLVTRIYCARFDDAFADVYRSAIEDVLKTRKLGNGAAAVILAWIHLTSFPAPMSRTAKSVLDGLAAQLATRRNSEIAAVCQSARLLVGPRKNEDTIRYFARLARFEESVREHQSSLVNSLRNMGRKLAERANPFRRR
jgi:hypothetical protein